MNAVLCGKRVSSVQGVQAYSGGGQVLFYGERASASELMVLSALAMVCAAAGAGMQVVGQVSPPIGNQMHRAFTYCTLCDLSFLECTGYVAGVGALWLPCGYRVGTLSLHHH